MHYRNKLIAFLVFINFLFLTYAWWDDSFGYRQLLILNSSINLNDYQVKIEIDESYSSFWNFVDSKGNDIRIVYNDAFELPYWIEYWNYTAKKAIIWFKTNLSIGNNEFYLYFGNPLAKSKSNGDLVFEFFDDFNTLNVDSNKWTISGDYSIINGVIRLNSDQTNNPGSTALISKEIGIDKYVVTVKIVNHSDYVRFVVGHMKLHYVYDDGGSLFWGLSKDGTIVDTFGYDVPNQGLIGYVTLEFNSTHSFLRDNNYNKTFNYGLTTSGNLVYFSTWYYSWVDLDFVFVRKFAEDAPISILTHTLEINKQLDWFDENWNRRLKINVTSSTTYYDAQVKLVIDSSWQDFWNNVRQDGSDLVFTNLLNNKRYPYYIESWDYAAKNATIWVRIDKLIPGVNQFYMYFGNKHLAYDYKDLSAVNDQLYVWWKFDGNGIDSLNGINATLISVYNATDRFFRNNYAIGLNNSQITTLLNPQNLGNQFSISFWIYLNESKNYQSVFNSLQNLKGFSFYYDKQFGEPGGWTFVYGDGTRFNKVILGELLSQRWYLITITYNNKNVKIYVNNELKASNSFANDLQHNNFFEIGYSSFISNSNLKAVLDDFKIFRKELSLNEVKTLYASSFIIYENKFDDSIVDAALHTWLKFENNLLDEITSKLATGSNYYFTQGKINRAIYFDNAYVDLDNFSVLNNLELSFSFWVKIDDLTKDNVFISKGAFGNNQPLLIFFDKSVSGADVGNGNTDAISVISYDGSTQFFVATESNVINDNTWHHVVVVLNRVTKEIKIYVDGILKGYGKKSSWNGIQSNSLKLRLGNANPLSNGLKGAIDDFKIYSRELSYEEVSLLSANSRFNSGKATFETFDRTSKAFTTKTNINAVLNENLNLMVFGFSKSNNVITERFPKFNFGIEGAKLNAIVSLEINQTKCDFECNQKYFDLNYLYFDNIQPYFYFSFPLDSNSTFNLKINATSGSMQNSYSKTLNVIQFNETFKITKALICEKGYFLFSQAKLNNSHLSSEADFLYKVCLEYFENKINFSRDCSDYYIKLFEYYKKANAHVSLIDLMLDEFCINTDLKGSWHKVNATTTPGLDYSCLFAVANRNNSNIFDCNDNAEKLWFTYVAVPKINEVYCSYEQPDEFSFAIFYCNVSFYVYGNAPNIERQIEYQQYNLSNNQLISSGIASDWSRSREVFVHWNLESNTKFCYRIRARNQYIVTEWSNWSCKDVPNLRPERYLIYVNPKYANYNDLVIVYARAYDPDYDRVKLICGNQSMSNNICESGWELKDPSCSFYFPWNDGKEHILYCRVIDETSQEAVYESEVKIYSIVNITKGILEITPQKVKNGTDVYFKLYSPTSSIIAELNLSELGKGIVLMNDLGQDGDEIAGDRIFTYRLVNASKDCLECVVNVSVKVTDAMQMQYVLEGNLTFDNVVPEITVIKPLPYIYQQNFNLEFQTSERANCTVNGISVPGITYFVYFVTGKEGLNVFNITCFDEVLNMKSIIYNVTVNLTPYSIKILTPLNYDVVRGLVNVTYSLNNATPVTLHLFIDGNEVTYNNCGANCISFDSTKYSDGIHEIKLVAKGVTEVEDSIILLFSNYYKVVFIKPNATFVEDDVDVEVLAFDARKVNFTVTCGSLSVVEDNTIDNGFTTRWYLPNEGICTIFAYAYNEKNQLLGFSNFTLNVSKPVIIPTFSLINYNVTQEYVDLNFTSNADNIKFYISKDNSSWIFVDEAFNFIRIYLPSDFNQTLYVKVIASLRGITKEFYFDIPLLKLLVKITKPLPDSIISETTVFEFDIQNRFNLQTLEFYIDQQKYTISNLNQRNYTVDTLNLLDGVHSFKVRVVDVFGNSAEHTIFAVVRNFRIVDIINVYDGIYLYGTKVLYFTYPVQTYKIEFFVNSTKLISKSDKLIDTYYFDTTQFSDGQYVIKLFAYDNRDEIIGNKSIVINILNKELPAPVLDLRDEFDSDGVIYLNWSAIDGAKSYRIYKSVSLGSFVQAYEVSTNSFVDYVPDGEYRYYVVAVDVARKEGNKSNIKSTYVIKEKPKLQIYLEKQHYKPYDIFNLNILASDHRNATIKITISELGITFNLAQNGSIFKGNYTLPSFNLEKWSDVVINYTDITNRTEIFTTKIFLDSKIDNYDFKLYTTSEVGFKEFNESVIVVPYVYYDIPKAYRCYVSSGIIEEFKNDVVGWPYSIDYASYLNYSNDLNDYSFVLLSLYLKNGTKIKIDNLVCNYDESLRELNCNNSKILTLNKINILIKNNTLEILNYSVNIARKNISIETAFIDRVVYSYDIIPFVESCSGLIYVSKQGWNNLSAVVYDEAGNVLILPRKLIYYDPSGGSLDVTPPSKARVVVKDRVVNKNNFTFYILDAKDFEQELLKIPLIYYYELKNVITNETLLQGITNETILNFNISEEKFINDLQLKLYVQVINSANLRSEISETETVTVDLINPSFVEISSQQYVDFNNWYNVRKPTINVVCNDKHLKGIYYGLFADNSTYDFNKMQFSENLNISLIVSYNGVNYLHLACVDEAGNYNYTYVTLKLDDTHPIIYGIKPVRILDDGGVLFEWDEGKDNIGISHYELMILDKDENVIKLINVTSTKHIDYSIPSGSYIGKVRAFDFAGNPSLWSDFAGLEYDDSAPVILAYGPVGEVKYDVITLYVKTDDVSICSYVLSTGESKVFDYTESTHHRTVVALQHPGRYEVNVSCKNKVNLVTNFSYSFYFIYDLNVGSLDVYTAKTFYDNQEVEIFVEVKSTTNNLVSNLRKSDFSIELTETSKNARIETTYGFADFGNGTYSLLIPLPAGNYNIVVDVLGVKKEYNFVVNPIFVNLELTTSNYNPSNNVVYVSESNGVYGVSKKAVNQEIIGNVLVAREGTYFDMFFSNTENIKKEPELVMREFVNYAMPMPEKTVALRIELDDVVLEIDPLLKYESLEGKRKLRIRNVGFDKDTGKVKLRIELLY
ncbi:MAG: DUF2341 domain-containing protein [Candidatus Woesearchaeota archaeon]